MYFLGVLAKVFGETLAVIGIIGICVLTGFSDQLPSLTEFIQSFVFGG